MPKKKLIELYSNQDLDFMRMIGSTLVYDVLYHRLTPKQRHKYFRNFNFFTLMNNNSDHIEDIYGKQFADFQEALNENENAVIINESHVLPNVVYEKQGGYRNLKLHYTNPIMDKPIRMMIKTMKDLSADLDKYIKEEPLGEDEIAFLNAYKKIVDDFASGRGVTDKCMDNPSYLEAINIGAMYINLNRPDYNYTLNKNTNKYEYEVKNVTTLDWKTVVMNLYNKGVVESFVKGTKLQSLKDSYINDGDVSRDELIKGYEELSVELSKVYSMTEEDYNKNKKNYGTGYIDFAGERAQRHVLQDAQAHVSLLKAGYPLSDTSVMAQFYVMMNDVKNEALAIKGGDASDEIKNEVEQYSIRMNELWKSATERTGVGKATRDEVLIKMADFIKSATPQVKSALTSVEQYKDLADKLEERKNARLTANDIAELDASPKVLYKLIDKVDPIHISSSDQFKQMKEALDKLSKIDKGKDPAGYELWRDRAINRTEAYVKFKNKQLHNTKEKHSRSDLEARRVKAANATLRGLNIMKKNDIAATLATDKRHVAGQELAYKPAKEFIYAQCMLFDASKDILRELNDIKAVLVSFQKNPNANFEFEEREGSFEYRKMTQTLEKSIKLLNDENARPDDVIAAVINFHKAAGEYHKEKEGIIFDPLSTRGKERFHQSEIALLALPEKILVFENARRKFENFRDANGNSYMHKPYGEIESISTALLDKYEKDIDNDRNYLDVNELYESLKEVTKLQTGVSKLIADKNAFMKENYASNHNKDYYLAIKKGMSVSEMAKNYVTKKYLDRLYNKDVSVADINGIKNEIVAGELEKKSAELAGNVVFKAVAKTYPEKVFSEWERIEKQSIKLQGSFGDKYNSLHRGENKKFNSADEYVAAQEGRENQINAAAFATVSRMLATPNNKTAKYIVQSLAADPSANVEEEFNKLVAITAKHIDDVQKKTNQDINTVRNDPSVMKKIDKKIIESYNTSARQRKEAAKIKARTKVKTADKAPKAHIPG